MNGFKFRHARTLGGLLAGTGALVTMLIVTSTAALAQVLPPEGGGPAGPPSPPTVIGGMPGWQITLIAVGAGLAAAALAVLADRARSGRRRHAAGPVAHNVQAHVSEVR